MTDEDRELLERLRRETRRTIAINNCLRDLRDNKNLNNFVGELCDRLGIYNDDFMDEIYNERDVLALTDYVDAPIELRHALVSIINLCEKYGI